MNHTFRMKRYVLNSPKIAGNPIRLVILSDLHGSLFGEKNRDLIEAVEKEEPDLILCLGDLMIWRDRDSYLAGYELLCALAERFPIYYALGNHEYNQMLSEAPEYQEYEKSLTGKGVRFLHNESALIHCKGTELVIYGLELPFLYYKKPFSPKLSVSAIEGHIGKPEKDRYTILLSHTPKYGDAYFAWGADLILSGHYHGGIVRLSENIGVISPQFQLFPSYCCGHFERDGRNMLVSAGLGGHSVTFRLHNPYEVLSVQISDCKRTS